MAEHLLVAPRIGMKLPGNVTRMTLQDTTTHPYWTGKTSTLEEGKEGSLARFRKRFGNLDAMFGEEDTSEPNATDRR